MTALWDLVENDAKFQEDVTLEEVLFEAKDVIIEENGPTQLYLIKKGAVRILTSGGKEKGLSSGLADLQKGESIGEFSLFDNHEATAKVVALLDCTLIKVDKDSLLTYFENNPDVGYKVLFEMLQTFSSRLREANKAVLQMVSWSVSSRSQ